MSASAIVDTFTANVLKVIAASTTGGRFFQVAYRRALEHGPNPGCDGFFSVEVPSARLGRPFWGGPDVVRVFDCVIDVAYFRFEDRRRSQRNGWQDLARIGDLCESPPNGNWSGTGIRSVTKWGGIASRQLPRSEIWTTRFEVEWQQPGAYG